MDYSLIITNISKHISLSPGEEKYFVALLKEKKLKRKDFLLRENEVCTQTAFVVKGCLRGYTIDKSGFEHVLQFAPPDWWISDMYSFISRQPGNLNIDALENTEVLLISRDDREKLFINIPKFERFFRILSENALVVLRRRLIDNMSLTAQDRFAEFCKHYPTLIEHLPQKMIASYIGVTPEFLSKVKADYFRKL
ncbi:MAG: Crp/Fnr family transcriptional regulator [Bacteroidetes bacterium]|nr:Crp/Fnr family transcriptional regulator [Bacteroidota bacterium]MBS1974318.1 Crp/Fnr family transcriptional regulator [Bacteroidota bacterium]